MEKNFFDQFDDTNNEETNFFDQFDGEEQKPNPLASMDESGDMVTLDRTTPVPYERTTEADTGNSVTDQLVNSPEAAYTDEDGVAYDSTGTPISSYKTETVQMKPSEAVGQIIDKEGNVTSRAYDGMSYGDALRVYEALANHPDAEVNEPTVPGGLQTIFLNGHRVPVPEPEAFGDGAKVSSVQLGGDQILQTASNLYDLIASGANLGIEVATGTKDAVPLIERQGIEKEGVIDNLAAEGPVIAGLGATGYRAANAIVGGNPARFAGAMGERQVAESIFSRYAGKTTGIKAAEKAAIRGAGVNTAITAGMDNDASGLFTGEDAAVKDVINILSTDKQGSRSAEILANKVNLLADAAVTGILASGLVTSASAAKKIFYDGMLKPIATWGSTGAQNQKVVQEIITATSDLGPDATRGEQKAFADRIGAIIRNNKDILARTPDGGIDTELDPLAALASALEASPNKSDQLLGNQARIVRNDIFGSNLPETNLKQQGYTDTLDDFGKELYESGGGREGVEAARSGIVRAGQDEVAGARSIADAAQADVDKNVSRIEQIFRMDATVGQKLAALEKEGVDINIYRRGNEALEKTVDRITKGEEALRKTRDTAYKNLEDAIPEEATFNDVESFDAAFEDAKGFIRPSVVADVENMDGNSYKLIRTKLLPAVNTAIKNTDPGSGPYQALLALKENIQVTQLNALDDTTKAVLKSNIDEVKQADEEYYNWFGKGVLKDVSGAQRGVNTFQSGNVNRSAELTAADRSSNLVDNLFDNSNRNSLQLVGEFLQTPEGGKNVKPLVDIGISKIVQGSRKTAMTDGVAAIDSQKLISDLSGFASTLEKISPKQYERLQGIITNLRKHEKDAVELERIAKEAETAAKAVDKEVLDIELGDFFKGSGVNRREITQGQQVFNGIFNDTKMFDTKVDDIIKRADQAGPEARNGVKAAFGNFIKFDLNEIKKNGDRTLEIAEKVYADQPQIVEAIREGFRLADITHIGEGSRVGVTGVASQAEQAGFLGINRLITMMFGVLNPTATKVRTISSIAAKNYSPKDDMIRLVGELASDSDAFLKELDTFVSKGVIDNPKRLFDFFVKAGIYSNTDEDYTTFQERLQQEQMNENSSVRKDDTEDALNGK